MLIFIRNIFRSLKKNILSIFSLTFFIAIIATVFSVVTNLSQNLTSGFNDFNHESNLHDAVINESYDNGTAQFTSRNDYNVRELYKSRINSTAAPYYYKNDEGKYVLSNQSVPIQQKSLTPPDCRTLGASFATPASIFSFLNPWDLQFNNSSGALTSESFDVSFSCGPTDDAPVTMTITKDSTDSFTRSAYNYIKGIFGGGIKAVNEAEIHDSSSGVGQTIEVTVGSDASGGNQKTGLVIILNKISFYGNTLEIPKFGDDVQWTKAYKLFYDNFHDSKNIGELGQQLAVTDQRKATSYLSNIDSYIYPVNLNYSLIQSYYDSDSRLNTNDASYALAKLFFKVWFDDRRIHNTDQWFSEIRKNNFAIIKRLLSNTTNQNYYLSNVSNMPIPVTDSSGEATTSSEKKTTTQRKIWLGIFDQLVKKNREFGQVVDGFELILKSKMESTNNTLSSNRIEQITKFIEAHKLWNVDNTLDNFVFVDPKTNKETLYKITASSVKSIIVTNPQTSQTPTSSAAPNPQSNLTYKVIQANEQQGGKFVDRLKIDRGNNLYYNPNTNYEILQKFLNDYATIPSLPTSRIVPFVKMLLRANFASAKVRHAFQNYYNYLTQVPNYFLSDLLALEIREYFNQLANGAWSYNGYRLEFNFTAVDFIYPLNTLQAQIQKIVRIPAPTYINNFAANFAVVSPTFATKHDYHPISQADYESFNQAIHNPLISQDEWDKVFNNFISDPRHHKNVLEVGGAPTIIVGIGSSVDFAFPALSLFNLIPDPSREALVYVNSDGYNFFASAFPSGQTESYIAITYPDAIKQEGLQSAFFSQLSKQVNKYSNKKTLYDKADTSMNFSATAYRVSFFDQIISIIKTVPVIMILILVVLTLFGVIVLIRKYVRNNRSIFGDLGANGFPRKSIVSSLAGFILVPAILGPIIGYAIALGLQNGLFGLISNYWFLDLTYTNFSFLVLLAYIAVFFGILAIITIVIGLITLKSNPLVLLRDNSNFKQSWWSLKFNNLFNKFSPVWKFRALVVSNSISRILLLSSMGSVMMIVLIFVFANLNQFSTVADSENSSKRYNYAIAYQTPTQEGGQYQLQSYNQLGQSYNDNTQQQAYVPYFDTASKIWKGQYVDFNSENPITVQANITNAYTNLGSSKFGADYNNNISSQGIAQAIHSLNKQLPINPWQGNYWARNSVLTQFMLRNYPENNSSSTQATYGSVHLPNVTQFNQKLFYASSSDGQKLSVSSKNNWDYENLLKQSQLFSPSIDGENTNNFYYSEYVPVLNEYRTKTNPASATPDRTAASAVARRSQIIRYSDAASATLKSSQVILAPDGTPLFQPLSDYYQTQAPLTGHNNVNSNGYTSYTSSQAKEKNTGLGTENSDFETFKYGTDENKQIVLPLLERLYKDNANYWIYTLDDRDNAANNLNFLNKRVIIKLLLNNFIAVNSFGINQNINMWDLVSSTLARTQPDVLNLLNNNNNQLIRRILNSRYAPFFVNRFMTMWETDRPVRSFTDGDLYNNRESYLITQKDLTSINNNSGSSETTLVPGLYYIDSAKTIYTYVNPFAATDSNDPSTAYNVFSIYRPDFLYFVYAMLNDPNFQGPNNGPIKVAFGDSVYEPNYANPNATWHLSGNPETDAKLDYGLIAEDSRGDNAISFANTPNGDQSYTYLNGRFNTESNQAQSILGLKLDVRGTYNLLTSDNKIINNLLYQPQELDSVTSQPIYPIIVNRVAARQMNLKVGSVINYQVENLKTRFQSQLRGKEAKENVLLKVAGISDTYYQNAFYISQKNANKILGLDPNYGFNGIFSGARSGKQPAQFSAGLSLYSSSGIYTSAPFNSDNSDAKQLFAGSDQLFGQVQNPNNLTYLKLKFNLEKVANLDTPSQMINLFKSAYGESVLLPMVNNLTDSGTSNNLFTNLSNTLNTVVSIILVIFIPLLVLMVLMITSLVIEDIKRLSTIMMILGFNNRENLITIITYLIPVFCLVVIVASPISVIFLNTYVSLVFTGLSILLPVTLNPWYYFAGMGILLGIFGLGMLQALTKLKRTYLPFAIKFLGD